MRVALVGSGSRGDLQAFVALGRGFLEAGHSVTLATHRPYAALVEQAGLGYRPLSGDAAAFFSGAAGIALRERWRNPVALARFCDRFLGPFMERLFVEAEEACAEADAVLYWPLLRLGPPLAEALGVPCLAVAHYPMPYQRTAAFPNPYFDPLRRWPRAPRFGLANRLSWLLGETVYWRIFRRQLDDWRRRLGLPSISPRQERRRTLALPHLLGCSPALLPRPRDWPETVRLTGAWPAPPRADGAPIAALRDFVAAGPPPVTIGFGSMIDRSPRALAELAADALERCGRRGVLLSGWGGLSARAPSADLFQIEAVDHDWLFPRSAAVVHHGGSGTTTATIRAGVPSVVVPFGFDQPLWAGQLWARGAAPPPIPADRLTAEGLAAAIDEAASESSLRRRAGELGATVRGENGVAAAVAAVEESLGHRGAAATPDGERMAS